MRLIRISAGLVAVAALGGCADDEPDGDESVRVVATTPVVADIAGRVAGGRAEIHTLLSPNGDPHEYEPRPSDARAVADADVVLRSGGELDEWLGDLVEAAGGGAPVIDLIDAVDTIEEDGGADPHWWHDPRNGVRAVHAVRDALTRADPGGRRAYARGAAAYGRELRSTDAAIARCMRRVPRARRKLVTTHDALGYFARRYGVEVVGSVIPSLSTEGQPSAGETAELIDQVDREEVRVIFAESSVSSEVEDAVARETGARVGDRVWADGLGPAGSSGDTYVGSLRANADAMVRGFTGGESGCGR
jgi:ABC-type Zn uptake system ZnuABC Zn-binding protein ZnuA